jgi:3-dehydroquinate synthetase
VVKHGLIASSSLLGRIERTQWDRDRALLPGMLVDLQSLVAQAIQVKIAIVQDDPFEEKGQRTFLNLGHTFGYGIEYASKGAINHGEAVAMGLVASARLSHMKGHARTDLVERIEAVVSHIGLQPRIPSNIQPGEILEGMTHDKKKRHSRLRFVLLRDVGEPLLADDVTDDEVLEVLRGLIFEEPARSGTSIEDNRSPIS